MDVACLTRYTSAWIIDERPHTHMSRPKENLTHLVYVDADLFANVRPCLSYLSICLENDAHLDHGMWNRGT